jgi:hypothetical protein
MIKRILPALVILFFILNIPAYGQVNFSFGSQYTYLKGSQAGTLSGDWISPGFDDSGWSVANAPFRYGDGSGGTEISDMMNNYTTFYMRSEFTATGISGITNLQCLIDYDDGFILWINGVKAISQFGPDSYSNVSAATELHESGSAEIFNINTGDVPLIEGVNTIAVLGLNENSASSDFYFDLSMSGTAVYSEAMGINFNYASGFYNSPFTLTITTPDAGATIIYTLDGSNPQTSASSQSGTSPVQVSIDPNSTAGRTATPAVVVRASLSGAGFIPSYPRSVTYIFTNEVLTQNNPGGDWPNYNVNGQWIDYEMDAEVVNDSRYTALMDDALQDIPSLSLITDNKNLWDPATGIYVNAWGHGIEWERDCNAELIYNDGTPGFEVNAGLRIRGGWSRHNEFPKHAFRLFFRSQYGDPKLNYPLFGDEGTDQFDKIDLRTAQNYAWSNGDSRNTMIREVFSRDLQRDMNRPYTRSRYYHLYLNGMYWGIYQSQERSEARYASDYFGDNRDVYDVVKVSTEDWSYSVEATDGELAAWQEVYSMLNRDMSKNENYFALEGRDFLGRVIKGRKVLIDIDNLIDYMLTIFYTGNFDAPTSSFGQNKGPNNFYAIYNREDNSKGFVFLNHDAEHSMMVDPAWPGIGLNENRVNIGDLTDGNQMTVSSLSAFHPQWLHYQLSKNAEYRFRFADRATMHLTGNGALTENENLQRFNTRVEQIETAIIAESARWGDAGGGPYTKDNHWLPVIEQVQEDFIPARSLILRSQLRQAGLYNDLAAPDLREETNYYDNGNYKLNAAKVVMLENPNSEGEIYYTLNGIDPRKVNGDIYERAVSGGNSKSFDLSASAIITARVLKNGEWSPLRKAAFYAESDDYSALKVTEIHYHPLDLIEGTDTIPGSDFEFIEFKNTGQTALNLSGFVLDSAIYCEFPDNSIIGPGSFFVAADKPSKFYDFYGKVASANFQGNFSNGGEEVLLLDASGTEVLRFTYDDHYPWPEDPDGNGPSMVAVELNPTGDPGDPEYWRTSMFDGGSPFADDIPLAIGDPYQEDFGAEKFSKVYPNPTQGLLHVEFDQNYGAEILTLRLYSVSGALIFTSDDLQPVIDLGALGMESGLYILRIEGSQGVDTHKVVYSSR